MKLAIPTTQNNQVDSHFGHCEYFTVFTIENNEIKNKEIVGSPQECGCKSNIAETLQTMGVQAMLAGGIGGGAINVLNYHGIDVYRGCIGDINNLVQEFIKGELVDSGETCGHHDHHGEGHQCNHHN
jgi:predicted Fe-Mo cluster-binding NifX family protein